MRFELFQKCDDCSGKLLERPQRGAISVVT
jgi:hypothetical protein